VTHGLHDSLGHSRAIACIPYRKRRRKTRLKITLYAGKIATVKFSRIPTVVKFNCLRHLISFHLATSHYSKRFLIHLSTYISCHLQNLLLCSQISQVEHPARESSSILSVLQSIFSSDHGLISCSSLYRCVSLVSTQRRMTLIHSRTASLERGS